MAVREKELQTQLQGRLRGILAEVPFLRLRDQREEALLRGGKADLALDVIAGGERWRLLVEFKGSGEPRLIRGAVQQLREYLADQPNAYGVVAAPYVSSQAGEICKAAGAGFIDLAGNCRLVFGRVFIERQGFPNPKVEQRPLRTLFAPKASRVIRVLFEEPKRYWQLQALAREAKVSLGLAFKVKQRLLVLEYASEEEEGVRLARPEAILSEWASTYSYQKNTILDCYGSADPPDLERAFSQFCRAKGIQYAFTLFSGAARVAPFTRYARGFAYLAGDVQKLAKQLGLKMVPSGANFAILTPFDEGVLYGTQQVAEDRVVSDTQLYLDLAGYKGRGEEAATFILEKRLRPRW